MTHEADEATVVYLEREGLINAKEASGLRRKISLTRTWLDKRVLCLTHVGFGRVVEISTPDLWGREIRVKHDLDGRVESYGPEQLELIP